jgi:nitroimidazol reductase NimA-like FMN-containing flavoprotein (pyridoxamine 5'-phosphate oxidase superfamily)
MPSKPDPRPEPTSIPEGYGVPRTTKSLLPWSWARERLEQALGYWLVTTRSDGRPHAIPTWGAWVDDRFCCEGSPETLYARNIARDPRVVVHLESVDAVVIVEGTARELRGPGQAKRARILNGYAKYREAKGYEADPANWELGGLFEVTPTVARGWERLDQATRWRFYEEQRSVPTRTRRS